MNMPLLKGRSRGISRDFASGNTDNIRVFLRAHFEGLAFVAMGLLLGGCSQTDLSVEIRDTSLEQKHPATTITDSASRSDRSRSDLPAELFEDCLNHTWVIEFTRVNDVPRGGKLSVRVTSEGELLESVEHPLGTKVSESTRTVTADKREKMFAAAVDAIKRFSFKNARGSKAEDVPRVSLAISTETCEVQIDIENWFAVDREIDKDIREFLNLAGAPAI